MQIETKYTIRLNGDEILVVDDVIDLLQKQSPPISEQFLNRHVNILQKLRDNSRLWEKWNLCQFVSHLHELIYGLDLSDKIRTQLEQIKQDILNIL